MPSLWTSSVTCSWPVSRNTFRMGSVSNPLAKVPCTTHAAEGSLAHSTLEGSKSEEAIRDAVA